jgi:hypothetical protein
MVKIARVTGKVRAIKPISGKILGIMFCKHCKRMIGCVQAKDYSHFGESTTTFFFDRRLKLENRNVRDGYAGNNHFDNCPVKQKDGCLHWFNSQQVLYYVKKPI